MLDDRRFWVALMAALLAFYGAAVALAALGHADHRLVRIAVIVLAVHVLELPLAFRAVRGKPAAPLRVVVATLLFGAVWWVPARRGVFAAR